MTAITRPARADTAAAPSTTLRFGRLHGPPDRASTLWVLKRNCSISPRHTLLSFGLLAAVTLAVAIFCLVNGAVLVLPFAGLEIVALGVAFLVQARHAADRERLELHDGRLAVECRLGERSSRFEFAAHGLTIARHGERALIELSGQGQRAMVGRFVRPELRRALADELRAALNRRPSACSPA